MNISFVCATFNVGTGPDFTQLITELDPKISAEKSYHLYEANLIDKIPILIESLDFVCLQELGMDCRHHLIEDVFKKKNFTVVGNGRLGVAFRSDLFELLDHGPTFKYDPNSLTDWQYHLASLTDRVRLLRPSYYADLQHKTSGSIVRVVSAHFKGFNVKVQKKMTKKLRTTNDDIEKIRLKTDKMFTTRLGDFEADATLYSLNDLTQHEPDVTIIGVDANATLKNCQNSVYRVHSKRLMKMETAGFAHHPDDNAPTLYDKADLIPRKYDYLFARFKPEIEDYEIISYADFQLTDNNPDNFISDHVPVKGVISYTLD